MQVHLKMAAKPPRQKNSKSRNRKGSLATSPNINREPKISFQQRLNPTYLKEESQIQKWIEPRQDKLNKKTQEDSEIQFFTGTISDPEEVDQEESEGSLKSVQSADVHSTQPQYLDSIIQIEEEAIVTRTKERFEHDTSHIYFPSSTTTAVTEATIEEVPTLSSQGLYEGPVNTKINDKNKNLLCNRLREENKLELLNENGELKGLSESYLGNHQLVQFEPLKELPTKLICIREDELNSKDQLQETSELVIKISTLQFTHHYLFSEEEFLARTIQRAYEEYAGTKSNCNSDKLLQKINFLKNKLLDTKTDAEEYKKNLLEILELRNCYHSERKSSNEKVLFILDKYKALKALRKTQQFNITSLKLLILTADEDKLKIEDFLKDEIQESYELELLDYQELKRNKKLRKKSLSPEDAENLPTPNLVKPSIEKIRNKIRKKYKENHFNIDGNTEVNIRMTEIPRSESKCNDVQKKNNILMTGLKYRLKIFCNNDPVGEVESQFVNENFEISFRSSITLQLTNKLPDQIRINVIEQRPLKPKLKLTTIAVPVPRTHNSDIETCDYLKLEFVSTKSVQSDSGIGSGQFCIRDNKQQMISGLLSMKIGWRGAVNFHLNTTPRITSRDSQYDPMNPENEFLNSPNDQVGNHSGAEDEEDNEFYFNEEELTFCSLEEFRNNPRNKILSERDRKNVKYKDLKMVPIDPMQFEETIEALPKLLDVTLGMDPIDLQRFKGKRFLSEVYSKISNYCKSLNEECEESHLLMDNMPTMASLVTKFFDLFGPNRPLKPMRRSGPHYNTPRLSIRNLEASQLKITLNIVRAFGIPQRQDENQLNTRKSSNMSSPKDSGYRPANIRPFVTASFRDVSVRTSTADGSNPTWNEQMKIPLKLVFNVICKE